MKKLLSILAGVVAAGVVLHTVGAWYTGHRLEQALHTSIQNANESLQKATAGIDGNVSIELVSLERHLYSSDVHYQVKIQSEALSERNANLTLLFVDHLEHGPLPLSRLKQLQLMPVMATSNIELENNPGIEAWFVAAKGAPPLKAHVSFGYNGAISGNLKLLPLDADRDAKALKFSGLNLALETDAQAQHIKLSGYMDSFKLSTATADSGPLQLELNGLTLASKTNRNEYGLYLGQSNFELRDAGLTIGDQPMVWHFKNVEHKALRDAAQTNFSAHMSFAIGEIAYNDKPFGSAEMLWSMKNIDMPAVQSMTQLMETKFLPIKQAQAAGLRSPALDFSVAEQARLQTEMMRLLSAKPQLAVEKFLIKTPNGEGNLSAILNLTQPKAAVLAPIELAEQTIERLEAKLTVSKALIGDLAGLQVQVAGETDPQRIAQQAASLADSVSIIAQTSPLAQVNENDIVSSLRYAEGQLDFNGRKMTLDEFVMMALYGLPPDLERE